MARLQDLLAEKDRLRELEGWQVRKSLLELRRTLGIFEGNARELQILLGEYREAAGTPAKFDLSKPEAFDMFLHETDRLLHNFLAAAESLREHAERVTAQHLPNLEGDAGTAEYLARHEAVFGSSIGSFVRELRNHVLHERIPTTAGFLMWSADQTKRKSGITLSRSDLREERRWRYEGAKAYLEEAGDGVHVHELAAYRDLAASFCEWLDGAIRRRNVQALDELDTRTAEVAAALKAAWGPVVEDPAGVPDDWPPA